nr:NAD(P)/FAD-dependent oxidoreductase [Vibrio coralliilyticus]
MKIHNGKNVNKNIAVIGAGVAGLGFANLIAKKGFNVTIFEKRKVEEILTEPDKRSINFTVSERGLNTFKKIGIDKEIKKNSKELKGRSICENGIKNKFIHKYGSSTYSIRRSKMIELLYKKSIKNDNIRIIEHAEIDSIDKDLATIKINNKSMEFDFILGADGAFSIVREELLKNNPVEFKREYFDWRYIEIKLTKHDIEKLPTHNDKINFWCGDNYLFVGIPNLDGSMSIMFSFHKNDDKNKRESYIRKVFPESIISSLITQLDHNSNWLTKIEVGKWSYKDKLVLIGDAAHAIYPFYGQGMNSAMEDALVLFDLIESNDNYEVAFEEYEKIRKPETDLLSEISKKHFYELKDQSRSYFSIDNCIINRLLTKYFSIIWPDNYDLFTAGRNSIQKAKLKIILKKTILLISGATLISASYNISKKMINL